MKRNFLLALISLITVFSMISPSFAAETWNVDNVHSSVVFRIKHNDAAWFFGRFNDKSGTITFDDANPANSSIVINVDPASVDSGNEKRDAHIMSPDFLSVKEFPAMSFTSTKVAANGEGQYKVTGILEIKSVKKEVSFDVFESRSKGMKGEDIRGYYAEFSVMRRDFNITEFPDTALSNQITMYVSLECNKA
jgi:polyisoprenoid-binding protein YceI